MNRWEIAPGYRWDGKIRGINFEAKWIQKKNDVGHREEARAKFERKDW